MQCSCDTRIKAEMIYFAHILTAFSFKYRQKDKNCVTVQTFLFLTLFDPECFFYSNISSDQNLINVTHGLLQHAVDLILGGNSQTDERFQFCSIEDSNADSQISSQQGKHTCKQAHPHTTVPKLLHCPQLIYTVVSPSIMTCFWHPIIHYLHLSRLLCLLSAIITLSSISHVS